MLHSAWHQHPVMMIQVPCWFQFSMPRRDVCAAHGGSRMLPPAEQLLFVPSPNAGGAGFRSLRSRCDCFHSLLHYDQHNRKETTAVKLTVW